MKIILNFILLSNLIIFSFSAAPVDAADQNLPKIKMPVLQISIPGLDKFSDAKICSDDKTKLCFNWIQEYIIGIYKYGIGVIGIIATVVMMIGGIIWLLAGGDPSKITEAKAWITASVTGLIIALSSYLILYTVNPDLIYGFKEPLKISFVEKIPDTEPESLEGNPTESKECNNCTKLASGRFKDGGYINKDIAAKLDSVNTNGIAWIVTEGYPPASKHKSKCHYNGMCADIGIRSTASCQNIDQMANAFRAAGFKVLNEFKNCGGVSTTYSTGGHLHISL